jgi:hypothetical protein
MDLLVFGLLPKLPEPVAKAASADLFPDKDRPEWLRKGESYNAKFA